MKSIAVVTLLLFTCMARADDAADALAKAKAALDKKDYADAVKFASQAIEADARRLEAHPLHVRRSPGFGPGSRKSTFVQS
jgi:hypothetical protein